MSSTTGCPVDGTARVFQITHPFHPLSGQTFTLVTRRMNWGEDRVMYFDGDDKLRSLPTSWTSVREPDRFVQAAKGRCWFRVEDLVELAALVQQLRQSEETGRRGVK